MSPEIDFLKYLPCTDTDNIQFYYIDIYRYIIKYTSTHLHNQEIEKNII